jgi:hypothetical protein
MTNTIYNFQILDFITDLDENITNTVVFDDGDDGEMTTFDFINPVTGSLDTVSFFEDFDSHPIIYVPNFSEGRGYGKDQLEIADLDELYDFILIDDEE